MEHHDALSVSMFWAGALMAFAPLLFVGAVITVWWRLHGRHLGRGPAPPGDGAQDASDRAQAPGAATRPR